MLKKSKIASALAISLSMGAVAVTVPAFAENNVNPEIFAAELQREEIRKIASEAYAFTYPLVLMDITRKQLTNKGVGVNGGFFHFRKYPPASFKEVVRPNFDTLYSTAWLDVSAEPVIISAPDTNGRYYLLPIYDMWTDIVAAPGSRTSGTQKGDFALVAEGWEGELPEGVTRLETPTTMNMIIGRTQANGPSDYATVNAIQDGYKITPLSKWGTDYKPGKAAINSDIDMTPPLRQVAEMDTKTYFRYASKLLQKYGAHDTDGSQLLRLKRIGLRVDKDWDLEKLSASELQILEQGIADAKRDMKDIASYMPAPKQGWITNDETMGVYGNSYMKRAIIAEIGLGANPAEDAIYPLAVSDADGDKLVASQNYTLHFEKGQLPPVGAFWSVTMYDQEGFAVDNELDRFAIGDRDNLKFNNDGSLTIYMQHKNPGKDKESNWLPAPKSGGLGVTMRLYEPKPEALSGKWIAPAIQKAN